MWNLAPAWSKIVGSVVIAADDGGQNTYFRQTYEAKTPFLDLQKMFKITLPGHNLATTLQLLTTCYHVYIQLNLSQKQKS